MYNGLMEYWKYSACLPENYERISCSVMNSELCSTEIFAPIH